MHHSERRASGRISIEYTCRRLRRLNHEQLCIYRIMSPIAILALALSASAVTVSDCGKGATAFTLGPLSVEPVNPVPGQNFTMKYQYTVPTAMTVTGGISKYSVTYNFIPFSPTTEPLCNIIPCPLSAGTYTNATTRVWPSGLSGTLTSQISWQNENSVALLCIAISGKVSASGKFTK